jgi:hypothetical protein
VFRVLLDRALVKSPPCGFDRIALSANRDLVRVEVMQAQLSEQSFFFDDASFSVTRLAACASASTIGSFISRHANVSLGAIL